MSTYRSQSFRDLSQFAFKPQQSIPDHKWIFKTNEIMRMFDEYHLLAEMGGPQGLAGAFRTHMTSGLLEDEVVEGTFSKRKEVYGSNEYPKPEIRSFLSHCYEALQDPMLIVLCIAGVISIILGLVEDANSGWIEGTAILLAVLIVTFVTAFNNVQQDKQFRELEERQDGDKASVVRNGIMSLVDETELVVGDVVELSAGGNVPADGIMLPGDPIKVNESKMTGESDDITKNSQHPFLQAGTDVKEGQCMMLVTAVGIKTAYGQIMDSLVTKPEATPLQKKLERVAALVGYIGGGVAILLFLALMMRWIIDIEGDDELTYDGEADQILDFFIIAVTIVVVAVPEGLPLAVTVSLAYSMKRMMDDQVMVRLLAACETMGNATTICSDKTGTLTMNEMTVVKGWFAGVFHNNPPTKESVGQRIQRALVHSVVLNSQAKYDAAEDKWIGGNSTEQALIKWQMSFGLDIENERDLQPYEKFYAFDSKKKNSSVILHIPMDGDDTLLPGEVGEDGHVHRRGFKGAAEAILELCNRYIDANDQVSPLEGEAMRDARNAIDEMTRSGLRTIAFCVVDFPRVERSEEGLVVDPPDREDCIFLGAVGIQDPLRPEAYDSVRTCQKAGIVVRMVTGDHLETAKFIAKDCGILTDPDHIAMLGKDFRRLIDNNMEEQLLEIIPRLRVLARSQPQDKEKLVNWLKAHDNVVAATGDGTNDSPALRAANVGLAMGIAGTPVCKKAADIVITDDNFQSIVKAVMWGRSVYDNIRKFVQFQLTVNVVALLLSLIGAFSGYANPLKAVQLLWVNLIMDTMAALALGTEVPTTQLLMRRPYRPTTSLFSPIMIRNILGQSALQLAILCIIMYSANSMFTLDTCPPHLSGDDCDDYGEKGLMHYTLVFNTFVWLQIFNELNSRKVNEEHNIFERFFDNWIFTGVLVVTVILQFLMVQYFGDFAETVGLSFEEWMITIGLGALALPWGVILRFIPMDPDAGRVEIDPKTFRGAHLEDSRFDDWEFKLARDREQREKLANLGPAPVAMAASQPQHPEPAQEIEMADRSQQPVVAGSDNEPAADVEAGVGDGQPAVQPQQPAAPQPSVQPSVQPSPPQPQQPAPVQPVAPAPAQPDVPSEYQQPQQPQVAQDAAPAAPFQDPFAAPQQPQQPSQPAAAGMVDPFAVASSDEVPNPQNNV